jgi:hypothetical protein
MKKTHAYNVLSTKRCNALVGNDRGKKVYCEKRLKLRLVEARAPHNITKCFKHTPTSMLSGHSKRPIGWS